MKKSFIVIFAVMSAAHIYSAHESNKDLMKGKSEDKFHSNTVEFIDFFKLVKEQARKTIMEGDIEVDEIPDPRSGDLGRFKPTPIGIKATLGKNFVSFSKNDEKVVIKINGLVGELPFSLQSVPANSSKNFTIKLKERMIIKSKFIKRESDFDATVTIENFNVSYFLAGTLDQKARYSSYGPDYNEIPLGAADKKFLAKILEPVFDSMIDQAQKNFNKSIKEVVTTTNLPKVSVDIIEQFMRGQTSAETEAENKEQANKNATKAPKKNSSQNTPSSASTSVLPTGGRSLDDEEEE